MSLTDRLLGSLSRAVGGLLRPGSASDSRTPTASGHAPHPSGGTPPPFDGAYPGDFVGMPVIVYAPHDDDRPDPGEVVWTWVPFEEDTSVGKDRPVLVIGLDGVWLLASQLTSKDHDRDADQEASQGRYWMDIGNGPWDSRHRPSEVRLDRIVRVSPAHVRRGGGRLSEATFKKVGIAIRAHH